MNPCLVTFCWKGVVGLLAGNILTLRESFYNIPGQNSACQSSQVVTKWDSQIEPRSAGYRNGGVGLSEAIRVGICYSVGQGD